MISYQDALQLVIKHAGVPHVQALPLLEALGKIAAENLASNMDVPSFCNSAMDGFAVRSVDVKTDSVTLPVAAAIAAGDISQADYAMPCAVPIMTGAPVPEPFNAVIPVEDAKKENGNVTFQRAARAGENIRHPGEDVRMGQEILVRGEAIAPEKIMLLSALGISEINVFAPPAIYILCTGKEIVDATFGKGELPAGKIYNSNAPYLLARCAEDGIAAHYGGIIADDTTEFEQRISAMPAGSVIITTGAVSKGTWDFIPESLKKLGAVTHFHRVNIRPGKPVLFATLPNGSRFFGLPGNPISTAVGFTFFVSPLLRALQGLLPKAPLMAKLENAFIKKNNFRQFLKAYMTSNKHGQLRVTILSGQESFKISPLATANAWAILEENAGEYTPGALISVMPFRNILLANQSEEKLCKAA